MRFRFALLPLALMCLTAGRSADRLISLDARDADVLDVIHLLAAQSGINVVTEGTLHSGRMTMFLRSVPFDRALRIVLQTHNLEAHTQNNILIIRNAARNPARSPVGRTRTARRAPAVRPVDDAVITRTLPLHFLRPSDALRRLESSVPEGSYVADDQINTLTVTGTPRVQSRVKSSLLQLDAATFRFTIDIAIVDIVPDGSDSSRKLLSGSLDGPRTYAMVRNSDDVEASLSSLMRRGSAQIIASPHFVTVNNRQAEVTMRHTYPEVRYDPEAGQQIEFVRIGAKLAVTPTLGPQGSLRIRLHPEYSAVAGFSGGYPVFEDRSLDATLRVGSQQTIVFGGALNDIDRGVVDKVPALADDSAFGKLFRLRSRSRRKDLIVFLIASHPLLERSQSGLTGGTGGPPRTGKLQLSVPVSHRR